jgi:hypothetical protein
MKSLQRKKKLHRFGEMTIEFVGCLLPCSYSCDEINR